MTNREKYEEQILDILTSNGCNFGVINKAEIVPCLELVHCSACDFFDCCVDNRKKWLNAEYKEKEMRLIDANHLLFLLNSAKELRKMMGLDICAISEFIEAVNDEPIAYDVDKVVEELRNACNEYYSEDAAIPYDKAVEIIKAGGVND